MSFDSLNKEELASVVEFFNKDDDLVVADTQKGASKKELVAALASGDPDAEVDGDKPVTWDNYKELYLPAHEAAPAKKEEEVLDFKDVKEPEPVVEEEDERPKQLLKFEGLNPRIDMLGYTFTKEHPYKAVPEDVAEYLVKNGQFRPAMSSEVADYYN